MDHYLAICAVITYVECRVQTGISHNELEKSFGFSLSHLRSVFSLQMGQSISRYIMSRRIAHAAFDAVHTDSTLLEISERYGFTSPDTFTRAFKRVTGLNPKDFRREKPVVGRVKLCMGVYGVSVKNLERKSDMSDTGTILYGVPKVFYGAFGGAVTPYPIALKAVANYTGIELTYEDAMVSCGAAFRLVWDTSEWNGGNVDVVFAFDNPVTVFKSGIEALGRDFKMLNRYNSDKDDSVLKDEFITFIKAQIDNGTPVIALGVIGPPEACVITGYRDGGQTLLGWNCFQDNPEFASGVTIDESGYFITSSWWENPDTMAVISFGDKTGEPDSVSEIVKRGVDALEGRRQDQYAKGIAAYDAWKKAILDESQFPKDLVVPLQFERLMCQGDGMDCVADGRGNAQMYFEKLAVGHPEQSLYGQIAEQFKACAASAQKMYETLGGWERGETQLKALMKRETRLRLAELIDSCKSADEKALDLMKRLVKEI